MIIRTSLAVRVMTVAVAIVVSQSPSFAKAPFSCDAADSSNFNASAIGVGDKQAEAQMSKDTVPEGLAGSDWNSIRQVYEQNRHAVVAVPMAVDGAFRARNPGQQWLTYFDGRGFVVKPDGAGWQWGLELQSYGFPGHQRSINGKASMTADNDRVTYDWHDGLHEWFVNDRNGLEHGFTLTSRPTGAGDTQLGENDRLELLLSVRGGLLAKGQDDGLGVSFVNGQGSVVVNYAGLKVWDADKRELPARIVADASGLRLTVDERGARYPLTIDPIAQQAYLKASNTDQGDRFGRSVAVSGDTVVIGSSSEGSNATGVNGNQNNSAFQSGAAYVFVRDAGGIWSQQAYLKASNTDKFDRFGWSVSVSGDTVVVGAYHEKSNATGVNGNDLDNSDVSSGAAYVFVRDGGVWSQQAYLKASNTDSRDYFGFSVSVSGDTVVVGAFGEDNSAADSGAAYVFIRDGNGVWSQQSYLKASNTEADDLFGLTVSVSGDTVVIGAWWEDSNATGVNGNEADNSAGNSGAAYVFVRDNASAWSQQAYLKASNTDADDRFGYSVTVSSDTVVVGAIREDSNAAGVNGNQADNSVFNSGAAYVFVRDGVGAWSQQAYLKASNTGGGDEFGFSVAVSGDTVVVGANREGSSATGVNGNQADNSADESGAAYVFIRDGVGIWSQQAYLKASNTDEDDLFGWSVAVSGDTVVVGAIGEGSNATGVNGNQADNSARGSGAVYVYHITPVVCGDGVVEGTEECDDGDTVDVDGCSATCQEESGFACLGEPSVCVPSDGLCGDLDDDLMVDGDDLAVLLAAFGRSLGDSRYNAIADLDDDGTVTLTDYQLWLTCYRVNIAAPFAAAPQPGIPGDLDADWDVDLADLADFEFCQSEPSGFGFPCLMKFDFDGNGQIDLNDYAEFQGIMLGP